jgi:hypothetical protein
VARQVVAEDRVEDPAVLRLLDALAGWDLHDGSTDRFPAARGLRNTLTPYRGAGLANVYGAGGGGVAHLARDVGGRFARDGVTPTNKLVRAYLVTWLRASVGGVATGRGAAGEARATDPSSLRPATNRDPDRTVVIPYQRTMPHNLPVVDGSMDLLSPPLTCLDQGTVWSQPGNLYSQIVDLARLDDSRSMMAPGNAEDGSFRTNQIGLWVQGTTHPAPLSRARVEALGVTRTRLESRAYSGPASSPLRTVPEVDPAARFVPAIPRAAAVTNAASVPLPGRKPDDLTLETAFRRILRPDTAPDDVDANLATCRDYVKGDAALTEQLRSAATLGMYLIEESQAGRLKVTYGSSHVLARLKSLLQELAARDASQPARPAQR